MVKPSIAELSKGNTYNRYMLVMMAAKGAKYVTDREVFAKETAVGGEYLSSAVVGADYRQRRIDRRKYRAVVFGKRVGGEGRFLYCGNDLFGGADCGHGIELPHLFVYHYPFRILSDVEKAYIHVGGVYLVDSRVYHFVLAGNESLAWRYGFAVCCRYFGLRLGVGFADGAFLFDELRAGLLSAVFKAE